MTTKNTGRIVGLLWLLSAVTGGFGLFYIRSSILVREDATATAANVLAYEFMYRTAIVNILLGQVFLFFYGLILFRLFKEVEERMARVMFGSMLIAIGIAVVNTLNHFGALMLLSGEDFFRVFSTAQLNALALMFMRLGNGPGQGLLEMFWAPYFFSFGLLVIRSKYLPKIIGVFLMIMGVGFAINILQKFLLPGFHPLMFTRLAMTGGALGALPAMFWLLIKGVGNGRVMSNEQ